MNIKVFQTNEKGRIEFTRCELEKLLNEVHKEGYREGEKQAMIHNWSTPTVNIRSPYYENNTVENNTVNSKPTVTATTDTNAKEISLDLDMNYISKVIDEIMNGNFKEETLYKHPIYNTTSDLAKELRGL